MTAEPISCDLLVKGWYVVTMNERRDIIRDGAVAVDGRKHCGGRQSPRP